MNKILIVGGSSGIGLSLACQLLNETSGIYIFDCQKPLISSLSKEVKEKFIKKTSYKRLDLFNDKLNIFDRYVNKVDALIITAGFGRVSPINKISEIEATKLMKVNMVAPILILKKFYRRLASKNDFYCAVMGSIAGHITSPLFSFYGAAKSGLCTFIKNANSELYSSGYKNRILDVSPGQIKGTNFLGQKNNLSLTTELSVSIIDAMKNRNVLLIPNYEDVYKHVIEKDRDNYLKFGKESYDYKVANKRIDNKKQIVVGYLSGTFDLFHIGHLNLIKKAKEHCDYLIVGVHESGSWKGKETFIPFKERLEIVKNIKYVDEVHKSFDEDSDAWYTYHFDKLFVGSDYKGSERFKRYERIFKEKGVEIIYFPYTKSTSSTQLREKLKK